MRQILLSTVLILASVTSVFASDRYPTTKRYVNQTGEIVVTRQAPLSYAAAPVAQALPVIQIVPVVSVRVKEPTPSYDISRRGFLGTVNRDPSHWPSGRTCCRPGEPYFNENPNS